MEPSQKVARFAGLFYLIESTGNFLRPGNEVALAWVVAVPAVFGEFSLTLWLLVKGIIVR